MSSDTQPSEIWRVIHITAHLNGMHYQLMSPTGEKVRGWMRGDAVTVATKLAEQVNAANKRREVQLEWQDWAWSAVKETPNAKTTA